MVCLNLQSLQTYIGVLILLLSYQICLSFLFQDEVSRLWERLEVLKDQ